MTDVVDKIAAEADSFNELDFQAFNIFDKDITNAINRLMNESAISVPNETYLMAATLLVKYVDLAMTAHISKKRILDTANHIISERMGDRDYDGWRSKLEYGAQSRGDQALFCELCETKLLLS